MSHFAVAVLSDGTKALDELLAPYQENNMDDVPSQYLEFNDIEDEQRAEWESGTRTMVHKNGRLYGLYDAVFKRPDASPYGFSASNYEVPEHLPRVEIPLRSLWPDFDAYMRDYQGEERDAKTGRYGYWENPNAKWDWWKVGGRWTKWAKEVIGGVSLRVGDIAFDPEAERAKAERFWDETKETDHLLFTISVRGRTREEYAESCAHLSFRACVTPDGKWHEVGEMGWWGMSSEDDDERQAWGLAFSDRFLTDPDLTLTVVDCHI